MQGMEYIDPFDDVISDEEFIDLFEIYRDTFDENPFSAWDIKNLKKAREKKVINIVDEEYYEYLKVRLNFFKLKLNEVSKLTMNHRVYSEIKFLERRISECEFQIIILEDGKDREVAKFIWNSERELELKKEKRESKDSWLSGRVRALIKEGKIRGSSHKSILGIVSWIKADGSTGCILTENAERYYFNKHRLTTDSVINLYDIVQFKLIPFKNRYGEPKRRAEKIKFIMPSGISTFNNQSDEYRRFGTNTYKKSNKGSGGFISNPFRAF